MLAVLYLVMTFILCNAKITELVNQSRMKLCLFVGVLLDFSARSTKSYIVVVYRFMRILWKLVFICFYSRSASYKLYMFEVDQVSILNFFIRI